MAATNFRYDGTLRNTLGEALTGVNVAVLDQPADTTTQPGSPLSAIFGGPDPQIQSVFVTTFAGGKITYQCNATAIQVGEYVLAEGFNPLGYNGLRKVVEKTPTTITVETDSDPGAFVAGGDVQTQQLPNPFVTDDLGNFFFYALPGIYTVQFYSSDGQLIEQIVLTDQNVVAGGGNGSVTSVALTMPAEFAVAGSPISSGGTFVVTKAVQNANKVYAGPASGPDAAPAFRALVAADIPGGTGLSSVGLGVTVPAFMSQVVTNSPLVANGTIGLALDFTNEAAGKVLAGPTSGAAAAPSFRVLVAADIPAGLAINWRGAWSSVTAYAINDAVSRNGSSFIAIAPNTNDAPPSANWNILAQAASSTSPIDIGVYIPGVLLASQVLYRLKMARAITFPINAPNSQATAEANATASTTITFSISTNNGVSFTPFATAVYPLGSSTGAYTQAAAQVFAAGDILKITGPASPDATLAGIGLTFEGTP